MIATRKISNKTNKAEFMQQSRAVKLNKLLPKKSFCYNNILRKEFVQYCMADEIEIFKNRREELEKYNKEIGLLLNRLNIDEIFERN